MEESDGGGGSGFSNMNMNHHHHQNHSNNYMVMGFNGVGAGDNNTMTMLMMPPPTHTNTTTPPCTTSSTTATPSTAFYFPHLPPLHHQNPQDHRATNNNHHQLHLLSSSAGCGGGVASMEFNQQQQQENHQNFVNNNKPSLSNYHFMADLHNNNHHGSSSSSSSSSSIKAKIMAHPHYPRLLAAYINCQKVGAPPEVVARLEEACAATTEAVRTGAATRGGGYIGEDPGLDQFMEAYCEMLTKYEQELTKPFKEAMVFLSRIESQFKALTLSDNGVNVAVAPPPPNTISSSSAAAAAHHTTAGHSSDVCGDGIQGSSDEEIDMNTNSIDPQAEDTELKCQLLRKYSGYLGSLKQEFMKKRKKGKLPKEARQQLLDWWTRHYKWPYPSEAQKMALAEATGLDPKQINNWFINQRKRHWKPSEDMQFVVMDAAHPHHYYMDNVLGNPFPMDISPSGLL